MGVLVANLGSFKQQWEVLKALWCSSFRARISCDVSSALYNGACTCFFITRKLETVIFVKVLELFAELVSKLQYRTVCKSLFRSFLAPKERSSGL